MVQNRLILNVDDDDGARYVKTRVLQSAGFEVIEAATGSDALQQVTQANPALVLLDVKLPDINGLEVCRRIKASPSTASVLVLQTSAAMIGRADRVRGLEGGADNYLVAPIEADELVANVNAMLRLQRVQSELQESETRFRQMAENIEDVFWMFTPEDMELLYLSPAFELLWGCKPDFLQNDLRKWLDTVHASDRPRVAAAFEQLSANGHYEEEFRIVRPDGSTRWVRDRTFPVKNAAPGVHRTARITSDVSAKKAAEQLRQDADSRKDEFLATLAHELRNPLGPIRTAVDLMEATGGISAEVNRKACAMISRQVDHMVRLVDDLLDISRISHGKVALRLDEVELKTFVQAAVDTAMPFIQARGHTLTLSLPDQSLHVRGDVIRLTQALANLLHNAAKYTPMQGTIALRAARIGDELVISVQDTGIGIAADAIDRIFDLFAQGGVAPGQAQDGLGVGLALVRKMVELHNGRIHAYSAGPGTGSTFYVHLPLLEPDASASREEDASQAGAIAAPVGPGRRILVVDDNPDAIDMLSMLLDSLGYETRQASSGDEAVRVARDWLPDVILMDIGLPGMNGYDAARALRADPALRSTVLVAITGYGQAQDRERALAAGFDFHLVKPVQLANLMDLLQQSSA